MFLSNTCTSQHEQNRGYGILLLCAQFSMDLWTRLWGRYHVPQNVFLVRRDKSVVSNLSLFRTDIALSVPNWLSNWLLACLMPERIVFIGLLIYCCYMCLMCRWPARYLCTSWELVKSHERDTSRTERYDSLHTQGMIHYVLKVWFTTYLRYCLSDAQQGHVAVKICFNKVFQLLEGRAV